MTISALQKVTLVGHVEDKEAVLADLQALGCLHLIPLTREGEAAPDTGPSKSAREALAFLASATPRRRQVTDARRFDADEVERFRTIFAKDNRRRGRGGADLGVGVVD